MNTKLFSDIRGPNTFFTALLLEELHRLGLEEHFLSPGLRLAAFAHCFQVASIPTKVFIDERAAGFAALGYAKAAKKPAGLFCTSGTAVANYLPAVLEASESQTPMLLITSDLTTEDHDRKDLQAVDQLSFFKPYLVKQYDLCASDLLLDVKAFLSQIDFAYQESLKGPVQINCRFRKPLLSGINNNDFEVVWKNNFLKTIPKFWSENNLPYTSYYNSNSVGDLELDRLIEIINKATFPIIIAGAGSYYESLFEVLKTNQLVLYADVLSGYRAKKLENILSLNKFKSNYDLLKQSDLIIQIGEPACSKIISDFIIDSAARKILITDKTYRQDTYKNLNDRWSCNLDDLFKKLANRLKIFSLPKFNEINLVTDNLFSELIVCQKILEQVPESDAVFYSNSLPVREADSANSIKTFKLAANRAINGIDGIIASAYGYGIGSKTKVWSLIGDIATLYDLNSLYLISEASFPVILVVLNNSGGTIFKLPYLKQEAETIIDLISTPHTLNFKKVSENFKLDYLLVEQSEDLDLALALAKKTNKSILIEVKLDSSDTSLAYTQMIKLEK